MDGLNLLVLIFAFLVLALQNLRIYKMLNGINKKIKNQEEI